MQTTTTTDSSNSRSSTGSSNSRSSTGSSSSRSSTGSSSSRSSTGSSSSAASNKVVSYATIIGDFGAGLVGFTVRGNNEGQLASRFESSPTARLVELHYAESCRRSGDDDYLCERVFRAVRGAVDFDALTAPTAPRGRLIARVRNATLVEWNVAAQKPAPGGDCVTLVNFDFESTFLPK